jgi:hypothetical protein
LNETVTFFGVEPLYGALSHASHALQSVARAPRPGDLGGSSCPFGTFSLRTGTNSCVLFTANRPAKKAGCLSGVRVRAARRPGQPVGDQDFFALHKACTTHAQGICIPVDGRLIRATPSAGPLHIATGLPTFGGGTIAPAVAGDSGRLWQEALASRPVRQYGAGQRG